MGTGDLQELSRFSDSNCKAPGISDNAKFAGVDDRKGWELWLFYDREQLTPVVGNIDPDTQIDPQVALQPDILQTKSDLQAISQCFISCSITEIEYFWWFHEFMIRTQNNINLTFSPL